LRVSVSAYIGSGFAEVPIICGGQTATRRPGYPKKNEKNFAHLCKSFAQSKKLLHRKLLILHRDHMAWHVQSCEQAFLHVPVVSMTVQGDPRLLDRQKLN
jgi:hypothetical protein